MVIRSDAAPLNRKDKNIKNISLFSDSLLSHCDVVRCDKRKDNSKYLVLSVNNSWREKSNIKEISFIYYGNKISFLKIIYFREYKGVSSAEYTIHSFEENSLKAVRNGFANIFISGNRVSGKYKNFQLVDNRNKVYPAKKSLKESKSTFSSK